MNTTITLIAAACCTCGTELGDVDANAPCTNPNCLQDAERAANESVKAIAGRHLDDLDAISDALRTLAARGYDAQAANVIAWHTTGDGRFEGRTDLPGALEEARNAARLAA